MGGIYLTYGALPPEGLCCYLCASIWFGMSNCFLDLRLSAQICFTVTHGFGVSDRRSFRASTVAARGTTQIFTEGAIELAGAAKAIIESNFGDRQRGVQ